MSISNTNDARARKAFIEALSRTADMVFSKNVLFPGRKKWATRWSVPSRPERGMEIHHTQRDKHTSIPTWLLFV